MPKDENEFVTSVNLSKLNGGDANNMVPSKATMVLDIRYTKENPPEIIFYTPQLIEGSNEIIVTAVSVDDTETNATEVVDNVEEPQEQGQEVLIGAEEHYESMCYLCFRKKLSNQNKKMSN